MKSNAKILFMFSMLFSSGLPAINAPLENIDEIGRPLGEVCEGKKAERLMQSLGITPQDGEIFFAIDNREPYKFREDASCTSSQPAGSSTSFAIEGGLASPIKGSAVKTSYTETVHHPRDRYFNDFDRLKTLAIVNTAVNHLAGICITLSYFAVNQAELKLTTAAVRNKSYGNSLRSVSWFLLGLAASCAYLGYKNIRYYAKVTEKEYVDARAKTAEKKYYKYDDLLRECRRPGYYRSILAAVVAPAIVAAIFASRQ